MKLCSRIGCLKAHAVLVVPECGRLGCCASAAMMEYAVLSRTLTYLDRLVIVKKTKVTNIVSKTVPFSGHR
jgi:hypothetical protein